MDGLKAAFLSYVHQDHDNSGGKLLQLIERVQAELCVKLGSDEFKIYVDRNEIEFGQTWRVCIDSGLAEAAVLVPIISPAYLKHTECRREFEQFVASEAAVLKRAGWKPENRLVLPLVFRGVLDEQNDDPIWQECQSIIFKDIEKLTDRHVQMDRKSAVTKFVKKLASRIVKLQRLVRDSVEDEARFANDGQADPLLAVLANFSKPLTSWRTTLCNGTWLSRDELSNLIETIDSTASSTRFLIGDPGTGKSAVLSKLCSELENRGTIVLGLKADALPLELDSMSALSRLVLGTDSDSELCDELVRLSPYQKVVVVIDQLDALGNLADLQSGRLNVMLDLIAKLRDNEGIHIVASVRQFELNVDERLKGLIRDDVDLSEEVIRLPSLTKQQVVEGLSSFDQIDTTGWPDAYFDFLAVPYHLAAFTDHLENYVSGDGKIPDATLFSSVQSMHRQQFDLTIGQSVNSESLTHSIHELVQKIESTESLWQPINQLSDRFKGDIEELLGLKWLTRQNDQIAFAHQTQYEYLSVRRFVNNPTDFVAHVIKRENGLFIRPTVWQGLAQMRALEPTNYSIAMGRLLARATCRHLKRLLMEFLSEVSQPTDSEIEWVKSFLLAESSTATMCWLLRGKRDWFTAIGDNVFESLMTRDPDNAWPVARLLVASWDMQVSRTTDLLRQWWAYREEYASHLLFVFTSATSLDDETFNWMLFATAEEPDYSWWANRSLTQTATDQPQYAYRLLTMMLSRKLERQTQEFQAEIEPDVSPQERERVLAAKLHEYVLREFFGNRWYIVKDLAQPNPILFVRELWPWFLQTLNCVRKETAYRIRAFKCAIRNSDWLGQDGLRGADLVKVLSDCVKQWAQSEPQAFIAFVVENSQCNSMTVQRLLARGVGEIATTHADFVLAFLRHDTRRFFLGGSDLREDTWHMIRSALPFWGQSQIDEFQQLVLDFEISNETDDAIDQDGDDQLRARFLWDVPEPQRSEAANELIARHHDRVIAENARYQERRPRRLQKEVATLKAADMQPLSNEELLATLRESLSNWGDVRANHGCFLIVEQFNEFSSAHPDRAFEIVRQLQPTSQEQSLAAAGIKGMTDSDYANASILGLVSQLEAAGFDSVRYRNDIADSIRKIALAEDGLPDDTCQMLSRWLLESPLPDPEHDPYGAENTEEKQNNYDPASASSVLWDKAGRLQMLPGMWFQMGEALKLGHCLSEPSRPEEWLATMHGCIDRKFPTSVWEAWLSGLLRYNPCPGKTVKLVVAILESIPDVLESEMGIASVAAHALMMKDTQFDAFLEKLTNSPNATARQGAGEAAALLWLREENTVAGKRIDHSLGTGLDDKQLDAFRIGATFTAAHEWTNEDYQTGAVDLLVRLAALQNANIQRVILTGFFGDEPLADNSDTKRLLQACAENIDFGRSQDAYWLIKHLRRFVNIDAPLTYRVMRQFVDGLLSLGRTETQRMSFFEDEVSNIVLTLHRKLGQQDQIDTLTLYEDLLDLEVTGAFERLRELDYRPSIR